jgi:hypothetical protein
LCYTKFSNEFADQLLYDAFKLLVDISVLQFILFFVVELVAVMIDETHDWCLPSWTSQEVDDDVEEPIVFSFWLWLASC